MAAREKPVVQGALIVCLILLLFSLIGNFFMWQSADANSSKASQAQKQAQTATDRARELTTNLERLKQMIGFTQMTEAELDAIRNSSSADPDMAKIEQMFNEDSKLLGPDVKASDVNYHNIPIFLMQTLRQRNETVQTDAARVIQVANESAATVKRETEIRQGLQKDKEGLQAKLQQTEEDFQRDRADMKQKNQELVDQKDNQAAQFTQARKKLTTQVAALEQDVAEKQATIETQRRRITELTNDQFESPQGKVVHLLPVGGAGEQKLYINLGAADLLRNGIIFGVMRPEDVRISDAKPKARIEVIRVNPGHMAEARVIDGKGIRADIQEGDPIFSPFWEPGRRVKIALAGTLDLNEDGRDDQPEIKALIESAGAEVVAQLDSRGFKSGKIDHDTRFVVVGSEPRLADAAQDPDQADRQAAYMKELGEFQETAKEMGVTIISLNKLLGWLRTLNDAKTVPLGGQGRAEDFPPDRVPGGRGAQQGSLSELYTK